MLARTHVFDDGTASPALPPPVAGPSVPAGRAYYRIDNTRIAGLRDKLTTALGPPPTVDGRVGTSLAIGLNLSPEAVAAANQGTNLPADLQCVAGLGASGNGCLIPQDDVGGTELRLFNDGGADADPDGYFPVYDSRILAVPFVPEGPFNPFRALRLPAQQALRLHPRISLGPVITTLADFMPIGSADAPTKEERLARNTLIRVRFGPEELQYGFPATLRTGGNLFAPRAGLYMPIDLTFEGGAWAQSHVCTKGGGADEATACAAIRTKLDPEDIGSCNEARFAVRINRMRLWLGVVPSLKPGCVPPAGDAANEWMTRLPFSAKPSERLEQGCLQLDTDLRVEVDNSAIALASSAEDALNARDVPIALWAGIGDCTEDIRLTCESGVIDCDAIVREAARTSVATRLASELPAALRGQINPFLDSDGSPYAAGLPDNCSPVPPLDATAEERDEAGACAQRAMFGWLPASVARLKFGFFANAFRGMPIVDVEACPPGLVSDGPSNPWDGCCPAGYHAMKDGVCALKPPPTIVPCDTTSCGGVGEPTINQKKCCGSVFGEISGPNAEGLDPNGTYVAVLRDPDGDGIVGAADNCPQQATNAFGNIDDDGDGFGRACDACPCSPNEGVTDEDGDGVCTVACSGSLADNCPRVPNKDQRNINAEAERFSRNGPNAVAALPYGDACEPVPVPEFEVLSSVYEVEKGPCRLLGLSVESCPAPLIVSGLVLSTQGAHPTREKEGQSTAGEIAREGVVTRAVFCVPSNTNSCSAQQVSGRDQLLAQASNVFADAVFRVTSVRRQNDAPSTPPTGILPPMTYSSEGASPLLAWDVLGDLQRWRNTTWGPGRVPDPLTVGAGAPVPNGRLWFNARSADGVALPGYTTAPAADKAQVGVHGLVGSVDGSPAAEANLANAYWGGWPVYNKPQLRLVRYREDFDLLAVPPCLECRQPIPEEPKDCLVCGVGRELTEGRLKVLPVLVDPFNPVFMAPDRDGLFRDVRGGISVAARTTLALPHRLASATDPRPTGEAASRRPVAVVFRPEGNAVLDTLFGGSQALGTKLDVSRAAEARSVGPIATVGGASPTAWSSSKGSFVTTYSRQRGEAFVIGGKTPRRDAEVWAYDVDEETWAHIALRGNVRIDSPLATVFLPSTNTLWVLDETRNGFLRTARLIRIDRATGAATVALSYPRLGLFDKQYLVEDKDGRLLFVASSKLLSSHVLLALDDRGDVKAFASTKGALAYAPLVDGEGYTFFVRGKAPTPEVVTLRDLPMRPGRSPELHRCF